MSELEVRQQQEVTKAQNEIESIITERRKQRDFVRKQTADFTEQLFNALKVAVYEIREKGLNEIGEPRLIDHPAGAGRRALQIPIEDWSVIFVPLVGLARPNMRDEAQIPNFFFKQIAGRLAVFISNEPEANSFFDFLILPNGAWFGWGYGWPRQASTIEETDFKLLAYGLLTSFIKDIFSTWRPRSDTTLGSAMDARKRAYLFGLPGDEL